MADIFNEDELAADAVTPQTTEAEVEAIDTRARDDKGRFAAAAEEAPPPAAEPPEGEPAPEGEQQEQRQVPQGALHAERERRKTAEGQLRQAQEQLQALATMRQQIQSRQPAPIAAPEADPNAELPYLRQRLEELEGTQQSMVQRDQLSQVEQAEHFQLNSVLTQSEAEFRAATPDYDAAINHVVSARAQELALYGLSPMEVQNALRDEVLDITRSAIQQGKSPAEVGYQLAKLRGYRPEAVEQAQQQNGNAQRVVEAVGVAKAASRSLGQASGTGATRQMDANTIASLSPDEFEALYSTPEGRRLIDAL